ncbi:MAG: RNA methyltransferase [Lentisphaerae bacterium]|nr:RNA methyltransferase [Lentisphaerota bacterium]
MPHDLTIISSLQNPRIKQAVKLRQRSHRTKLRRMLVEGYREIKRALDNNYKPESLFFCPALFLGKNEQQLLDACLQIGTTTIECTPRVFEKIAYRERPEGLLAVMPYFHYQLSGLQLPADPLLIVAEAIEKPGNLGTILRSADAAGVHAVIVCDQRTDIFNPNVVRASIGTLFSLPVVIAESGETRQWLTGHGIRTLAATPHAEKTYTEQDLRGGVAIVLGTEQFGLSREWMDGANMQVRIPMQGQADSLNVAAAATILMFEALRQRSLNQ